MRPPLVALVLCAVAPSWAQQHPAPDFPLWPANGWAMAARRGPVDPAEPVRLRFALARPTLPSALMAGMADPVSPTYGQHLSPKAVAELVRPRAVTTAAFRLWLAAHSSRDAPSIVLSPHGDYATIRVTAAWVVEAFGAPLAWYTRGGRRILRVDRAALPLRVPEALRGHVDFVTGLDDFLPAPRRATGKKAVNGVVDKDGGMDVTPTVLHELYGLNNISHALKEANQSVAEFESAFFFPSDVENFLREFHLPVRKPHIVGPNKPSTGYLGEASLDVEYIMSTGVGVGTTVVSIDPTLGFDLIAWASNISAMGDAAPRVQSISWGERRAGWVAALVLAACARCPPNRHELTAACGMAWCRVARELLPRGVDAACGCRSGQIIRHGHYSACG